MRSRPGSLWNTHKVDYDDGEAALPESRLIVQSLVQVLCCVSFVAYLCIYMYCTIFHRYLLTAMLRTRLRVHPTIGGLISD